VPLAAGIVFDAFVVRMVLLRAGAGERDRR
jgi:hypothetical protein